MQNVVTYFPEQYTHIIDANGGYNSATWQQSINAQEIGSWLNTGLMRNVRVTAGLSTVFEGFVNRIDVTYGTLTASAGPALDVANRVAVLFSEAEIAGDRPIMGLRDTTAEADDTLSQERYGIQPKILSTGSTTPAIAAQIRNMFLEENAEAPRTMAYSTAANPATVTISCLGYRWLLNYPYNQTGANVLITTANKIRNVIAADPNGIFDDGNVFDPANPAFVMAYEEDNNLAWDVISEAVTYGDADLDRWLFGVYDNRVCLYDEAPSAVGYYIWLTDARMRAVTPGGMEVPPWLIRPGRWAIFADLMPGYEAHTIDQDDRSMFIESVTYTAPMQFQLTGEKSGRLRQLLAQYSLGGI